MTNAELARKILEIADSHNLMLTTMTTAVRGMELGEDGEQILTELSKPKNLRTLLDDIIDIYAEEYTTEELELQLSWFEMPGGKELIVKMGQVAQLTMQAGMNWGEDIGRRLEAS